MLTLTHNPPTIVWHWPINICILCSGAVRVETFQGPNEKRLFNDLFGVVRGYNRLERPVINDSEALVVKFGLVLQQIIDVVSSHSPACQSVTHAVTVLLFSVVSVCLSVCLLVCQHDNSQTVLEKSQNFQGIILWSKGQTSSKVDIVRCTGDDKTSGVLVTRTVRCQG